MTDTTITLPRSVVEQALEALFMYKPMVTGVTFQHGLDAMQALRAALEQSQGEQEPIAWANINKQGDIIHTSNKKTAWAKTPIYTYPQPKREPLTDGEIVAMWRESIVGLARSIERAHGIGGDE